MEYIVGNKDERKNLSTVHFVEFGDSFLEHYDTIESRSCFRCIDFISSLFFLLFFLLFPLSLYNFQCGAAQCIWVDQLAES